MKGIKKLQQIIALVIAVVLVLLSGSEAYAATKPKAPKKVNVKLGVYHEYANTHNIQCGDGYSAKISWSKVKKADGYRVKLYWNSEGTKWVQTVIVAKQKGKYKLASSTDGTIYSGWRIYKNTKNMVYGSGGRTITSSKLLFCICGGSCEEVDKVVMQSYKKAGKKKIYSKKKVKKVDNS